MAGDQVGEPYRADLGEQRQVIALLALLYPGSCSLMVGIVARRERAAPRTPAVRAATLLRSP
jgi:hypothetical protein